MGIISRVYRKIINKLIYPKVIKSDQGNNFHLNGEVGDLDELKDFVNNARELKTIGIVCIYFKSDRFPASFISDACGCPMFGDVSYSSKGWYLVVYNEKIVPSLTFKIKEPIKNGWQDLGAICYWSDNLEDFIAIDQGINSLIWFDDQKDYNRKFLDALAEEVVRRGVFNLPDKEVTKYMRMQFYIDDKKQSTMVMDNL